MSFSKKTTSRSWTVLWKRFDVATIGRFCGFSYVDFSLCTCSVFVCCRVFFGPSRRVVGLCQRRSLSVSVTSMLQTWVLLCKTRQIKLNICANCTDILTDIRPKKKKIYLWIYQTVPPSEAVSAFWTFLFFSLCLHVRFCLRWIGRGVDQWVDVDILGFGNAGWMICFLLTPTDDTRVLAMVESLKSASLKGLGKSKRSSPVTESEWNDVSQRRTNSGSNWKRCWFYICKVVENSTFSVSMTHLAPRICLAPIMRNGRHWTSALRKS